MKWVQYLFHMLDAGESPTEYSGRLASEAGGEVGRMTERAAASMARSAPRAAAFDRGTDPRYAISLTGSSEVRVVASGARPTARASFPLHAETHGTVKQRWLVGRGDGMIGGSIHSY